MNELWLPLAKVAAILLAAGAAGYAAAGLLLPAGRVERMGWGFAIGLALLAVSVPIAFATHLSPRWTALLLLAIPIVFSLSRRKREEVKGVLAPSNSKSVHTLLLLLIALGVAVYLLRALTEPMWSNDFLAIWGFKGRTIFGSGEIPRRLFTDASIAFSHPEYPLGLPLLYAELAFLLGRFDDHAMALLFPFLQAATLLALYGWLRRRGASRNLAAAAAALLSLFAALYSAFLTGMADVPFSFAALLFGASLADALDRTDRLAASRLSFATFLAVSTKNEGLLLVAFGGLLVLIAFARRRSFSVSTLAALLAPSALLLALGRLWKGSLPLRDFDLTLLNPSRVSELLPRVGEAVHTAAAEVVLPAWPGLLCVAVLIAAGRRALRGNLLLALATLCALAYLLLPSLAVLGPDWLVRTSFARTVSALAPLAAAAIACRLGVPGAEPGSRLTA